MKTLIKVTREHISKGGRGCSDVLSCPISLALKDAGFTNPKTWLTKAYIENDTLVTTLPIEARDFIRRFDNQKDVKPFSFYVDFQKPITYMDVEIVVNGLDLDEPVTIPFTD